MGIPWTQWTIQRDTKQDPSKNEYTKQIWFLADMWLAKQQRSTKQCPLGMIHLVLTILLCDSVEKYPDGSRARGSSQVTGCKWGHVSPEICGMYACLTLWRCHSASDVTTIESGDGEKHQWIIEHINLPTNTPPVGETFCVSFLLGVAWNMGFPYMSALIASLKHPTFIQIQFNFFGV